MLHAHSNVFHVIGRSLAFRSPDLEVVGLQKQHQVSRWWRTVDRSTVAVLEQHREHACVVQVRVRQDHGVQLVEWQGLRGVEEGHRVGVRGDVHAHIDHDP